MTKNDEIAFNLSLHHRGLRTVTVSGTDHKDAEISGSLGTMRHAAVLDEAILEIRGETGTLRIALPVSYLASIKTALSSFDGRCVQ